MTTPRTSRRALTLLATLALAPLLLAPALAIAPARRAIDPTVQAATAVIPDLQARLAALTPSDPRAYFLLAEELAAEDHLREARALAERLYVLAFTLDYAPASPMASATPPGQLASSAALGLVALSPRPERQAWLRALAMMVRPASAASTPPPSEGLAIIPALGPDEASITLAAMLSMVRTGDGRRARMALQQPGVRATLDQYEDLLTDGAPIRASQMIDRWIEQWPQCPTCSNRRVLQRDGQGRLCPNCNGTPGPDVTPSELAAQLRATALLMRGVQASWAAQNLATTGQTLQDPDPRTLADLLQVDPRQTIFRAGAWTTP
ncbi:MAG: hypothetical protein MUE97_00890 [Phycisphaerales bacterium]|nr:hypothetical protein [Phycisphaerales bacterium]